MGGGLYDQHPDLLDQWYYIFARRADKQHQEEAKRKAQANRNKARGPGFF